MESEMPLKFNVDYEGDHLECQLRLLDELKCLELQQKRSPRQIKFQEVLRIELKEHEIRFNGSWCVFRLSEDPRKTQKQKDFLRTVLSAILKYWRETFPKYNYCDDSLLVAAEAMYELIKEETCELNKNACFQDAEISLVHPLDNYFKESRLKNLNFASLEKSLQVSKASKQIRYLKLSVTSKSTIDNAPVVMLAVSSLSSSTVVDLSGEKIDEDLLKVLKVSFKINKSFRGLTMINPQVDGGFLSDALKFLSPFSLLRLLDVSNKSKNEKDKHDDRVLKGLSANAARNLVDFRINGQNLSAEDVSRLTSGFRNSIVNVSANTLPLISLSLSGNTVKIEDLQYLLSVSPYLRELQLDECQLDVFEVMNALQTPKCKKLELLSLKGNRFGNAEVSDGKGFGELENLSSLNLSMCQGKGAATAICSIWTALKVTENFKRGCSLIIRDCGLSDADAKTLISHLSDSSRIRSLNIEGNHFSDETKSLLEALLQKAGLQELSISTSGKTRLQMSTIAKLLNAPECTVRRLKLGKMTSNDEIVPFLTCLADKNPLELLDISEYTLKDADASAILRLLWGTEKEFTLVFNPSNMKQAQTLIENFVSRKSVHSTFETLRKYEDANRMIIRIWKKTKLIPRKAVSSGPATPFPESERLVSELVNPPSDVLMAQEKLSSSIARLQLRLPAEDLSYLSTHLPDVDIAKNAIEEYRSTPSLHVELLDSALDPTVVAKARANVLKKVTQALKDALEETAKDTIESVFNELKPVHGKEFCSVHPRAAELVDKVESLFNDESSLLQKQLSQLVTPMILGVNARLVQQMYTYILEAISTDVQNCLEKLPERSELISRPSAPSNSDEYAQISDLPAVKSETISPPIEESPSQETIPVTHFTKSPTSSSPPAKELVKGTGVSLRPKESIASDKAASKRLSGHRKSSEVDAASKRHSGNRRSTEVDAGKIGRISSRPLPVPLAAPPTTPAISMGAEPTKTDASGDDEGSNVTSGGPLPCLTAGRPKPARKTVSHKIFVSDDGERISGPVTSEGLYDVPEPAVAPSQNAEEPPAEEVVARSPPTRKPGCLPPGTVRPPSVQPQVLQGLAMNLRTRPRPPPVEAKTESEPEWIAVRKKITQSRQISQSSIAETPSETVHEEAPTATTSPTATTWEPKRELPQLKPS